ncbi:copper chaperone PCu(A)C [Halomonas sp. M20]|uniref:copper chaperone PCu(A)C n=1 Tax=Halomonas sp. M20 TaxID=2763264 RepID=UPI001D0A3566|nr:copper chaperone PCu(A)C [Halomonas sp. M20]
MQWFKRHLMWGLTAWLWLPLAGAAAELAVDNAHLRLLPGELPAAGYFDLRNTGDTRHVLVGAKSAAFERVVMHESSENNGTASMKRMKQLTLAPGERVRFAPGGYHLMFMERTRPLEVGDEASVTLEFVDEQRLPVTFRVVSPTFTQEE